MTTRVASVLTSADWRWAPRIGSCRPPRRVTWITFFGADGLWRTLTDACGLLRTLATGRRERAVFASGRDRLHSGYRSQERAANGAGLNAQGHRRLQDRRP